MKKDEKPFNLTDKLLIAMPNMVDLRFENSVIYICDHSDEGAMGLVVNKPLHKGAFNELCKQLSIELKNKKDVPVLYGGPVEPSRGFVIHSRDYTSKNSTKKLGQNLSLTATRDVIDALALGETPADASLFMGYSGWAAGQIEHEILQNVWLVSDADKGLVLGKKHTLKWRNALKQLGIDASMLSTEAGRA
tara:strand:- start:376 stop:948 length:573 start_codon:yes stop_codon:yes gene_type:complete